MAARAGALGLGLALWLCAAAVLCAAAELRLTLLHTNDVHGRVEAQGTGARSCAGAEGAAGCFGGVARRAARVAAERAAHHNVLLLDAGDQYQGTVWFSRFRGREAAHFMNLLRYDAMVKRAGGGGERLGGGLPPRLGCGVCSSLSSPTAVVLHCRLLGRIALDERKLQVTLESRSKAAGR